LILTIDLAEDLLDLLLAPIAVDVHLEHAGLPIWGRKHTQTACRDQKGEQTSKLKKFRGGENKKEHMEECLESRGSKARRKN
jgi:hypothetical protein